HEDDLDEMDLKWQLALLSMKARKFYQRIGKKIIINGSDTASYDKKRVECFNCHKLGYFARECRSSKSQENRSRSQDSSRRTVNVEESSSKGMIVIDGTGFDWSYMAEEEATTNYALMAFSEVQNNKTCFKTCLKNFEDLKSRYDKLRIELNKSESDLDSYKRGLASVEEQLVFYKKNKSMLCDQIAVLKRDASFNESDINALKKLGLGYNAIAPPLTGLFAPPIIDLSNSCLEKFKQPEFEGYDVKNNKSASENVSKEVKKTSDAPIIKDCVSDCDEDETVVLKSVNVQKPKQVDQPRSVNQNPRNNSTNCNIPMSKKLGVGFQFKLKACFVCGSFNHLIKDCDFHDKRMIQKPVLNNVKKGTGQREVRPVWTNAIRDDHQNFSNSRKKFAPTTVLTKSGLVPFSIARQSFSRTTAPVSAARPFNTVIPKPSVNVAKPRTNAFQKLHSSLRRPFYQQTTLKNINLNNKVNTAKRVKKQESQGRKIQEIDDDPLVSLIRDYMGENVVEFVEDVQVTQKTKSWSCKSYEATSLQNEEEARQINMLVEKKYPLKKEILKKMINLKLEAKEESPISSELLQFIKSQNEEQN
ncbi:ribonuclease H-like domain-containing protein, partial [Tanacetum coccineum]